MNKGQAGWLLLLLFGLMLIVLGIQGNLGVLIAIIFSPGKVSIQE